MAVLLLKTIFFFLSTVSYFVTRILFTGIAYVLVFVIQTLKVPGENAKGLLEQVAESVKVFIQYLLELGWEAFTTGISMSFDLVKEGVIGSASAAISSVMGLMEQTRSSFEGLVKDVPELVQGFSEMASTIVSDLWSNYMDALGYVKEQITSS